MYNDLWRLARAVTFLLASPNRRSVNHVSDSGYKVSSLEMASTSMVSDNQAEELTPSSVSLSVCLSPGCIADGAPFALDKMKAIAPAHMDVEGGPCRSFCGSGPVVVEIAGEDSNNSRKKGKSIPHKRMSSEDRMLKLLYPDGGEPKELIEGFNLAMEGNDAYDRKDFAEAIRLYGKAVQKSSQPAMDLQRQRDKYEQTHAPQADNEPNFRSSSPRNLEWLATVRRKEALAKMEVGDLDGALLSIQESCSLSGGASSDSIVVLAKVYQRKGDDAGEKQALEDLFGLPVDEDKLSFQEKNDRRLAKLRLQKLQFQQKS